MQSLYRQLWDHLTNEDISNSTQRRISALIDAETSSKLLQETTSAQDRARLNCVVREGASDWLTAIPSKALGLHLRAGEFTFGAKYGDHAISCGIGGKRT